MQTLSPLKRGDTFNFYFALTDAAELTPITGLAAFCTSQMRDRKDALTDAFTVTETTTLGTYLCTPAKDSSLYEAGVYLIDVRIDNGGFIRHTATFSIEIQKCETFAPTEVG